ncbi:SRPBCC family protein [Desulfosarcina sp.]|uniref:SRPBCC family protein n=1 Tax=Desulfosarcina sp. TaxID=2027861 RepID=UPI003563C10E
MNPPLGFSRQLDAPANRVWRLITDTRTWPVWGPSIRGVDCQHRYIRAGSNGRILTALGVWMPFVVGIVEPESYWDWRVAGVAATGHRVEPLGPNRCRLTFTVPGWAFGYGLVCRLALMRIDRLLMQVRKQHVS